jgi:hypothetical protein
LVFPYALAMRLPDLSAAVGIAPKQLPLPLPLLAGTSLDPSRVALTRCYKASVDGWSAVAFHRCVDDKGSGLVVARSRSGCTLGGFNPLGWRSSDDYGQSMQAFLFAEAETGEFRKAAVFPGGEACIFDYASAGPCFGAADLVIGKGRAAVMGGFAGPDVEDYSVVAGDCRDCTSSPGGAYERVRGWPRGALRLVELEVWVNEAVVARAAARDRGWWPFR